MIPDGAGHSGKISQVIRRLDFELGDTIPPFGAGDQLQAS